MESIIIHTGVVLDPSASVVRVALRVYFTLAILLITLLGAQICALIPKLHLLRTGRVRVLKMTGWLSPFDAAYTMWLTRANPLGIMGIMMVLVGIIMAVSDLTTSGLVNPVDVPGRCPINTTASFWTIPELTVESTKTFNPYLSTPGDESSKAIIKAEEISRQHGGVQGIYRHVDNDPRFLANEIDIHGSWRCLHTGVLATYNYNVNSSDIQIDLATRGLIYSPPPPRVVNVTTIGYSSLFRFAGYNSEDLSVFVHREIDIVSANHTYNDVEISMTPWDVKFALQHMGSDSNIFEDKVMHGYHCKLEAPKMEYIWYLTDPIVAFQEWLAILHNDVFRGGHRARRLADRPELVMQRVLNNVFMNVASAYGENGTTEDGSAATAGEMTKGCLLEKTSVPWPVLALFITVGLMLFWTFGYYSFLHLRVRQELLETPRGDSSLDVPIGLISWLKYMVNREEFAVKANSKQLVNWEFNATPMSLSPPREMESPREMEFRL
jgi:hypothetical protein